MTSGATTSPTATIPGAYAPVNGLNLYYEIHGEDHHGAGHPLVLIHGSLDVIGGLFVPLLPALAQTRQVIAVELQAHGRTADVPRPLTFEHLADDVAALLQHLGIASADVMGYSLGGGVALQTAIRHPSAVRKLVVVSAVYKRDGWYSAVLAGFAALNPKVAATWVGSPMHQAYASVAPHPDDWPALVGKVGELVAKDYDWTAEVAAIAAPALIITGDADGVRLEHAVEMFRLLGGVAADGGFESAPRSQLAILPATTHLTVLSRTDLLLPVIPPFLDAPMPAAYYGHQSTGRLAEGGTGGTMRRDGFSL